MNTSDKSQMPETVDLPAEFTPMLVAYEEGATVRAELGEGSSLSSALQDRLQEDLACIDLLREIWPDDDAEEPQPVRELGDFRIVREIGRGGMGVVYEAEQLSLGRQVALKVLPFAAILDPHQLARFKNEAQAAASLTREGIVPVYGVGCDRGVHYYAMQLIEGCTLSDTIAELRNEPSPEPAADSANETREQPVDTRAMTAESTWRSLDRQQRFRAAAELAAQAAEALDYAHDQGIVHRDIKPSNLIVDLAGRVWITDFGLARVEANPQLTTSGDLLGTLKYMAPEQAQGKPTAVDHRADIYGLGATLYELLTLKSLIRGSDRQAMLQQIATAEPTPPRTLQPAIPRDLETIVLKAVAKDAADRYASAAELAADLRRFLDDKPIAARRPGWLERVARAARRHPRAVALVVGLLVLVSAGLATGMLLVGREQVKTSAALTRAEQNFRLAMTAVERLTPDNARDSDDKQLRLLEEAAQLYQGLQRSNNDAELVRREAEVLRETAVFHRERGHYEAAEKAIQAALRKRRPLAEVPGAPSSDVRALALDYNELSHVYWAWRKHPESARAGRAGLRVLPQKVSTAAENATRAILLASIARNHWRLGSLTQAEKVFREAIALEEDLPTVQAAAPNALSGHAGTLSDFSMVLRDQGEHTEATKVLRKAVSLQKQALEAEPGSGQYRTFLNNHLWQLAQTYFDQQQYADCMETARQMVEAEPHRLRAYSEAAEFIMDSTAAIRQQKAMDEARAAALDQLDDLARSYLREALLAPVADPEFVYFHIELLAHDPQAAYYDPADAVDLGERLVRRVPTRARFWTILALARYRSDDLVGANAALDRAESVSADDSTLSRQILRALVHAAAGDAVAADAAFAEAKQTREGLAEPPGGQAETSLWQEASELFGAEQVEAGSALTFQEEL